MNLRIHALMEHSTVNGPGNRAVLWFQGCSLSCPGCWNPETWDRAGGRDMSLKEIIFWLLTIPAVDGITLSGGEPMQQPTALATLLERIRAHCIFDHLSIGMFSGYTEAECEKFLVWPEVKRHLDWAVLGRYNRQQPTSSPLVTSRNQRLCLYSDRYTAADFGPLSVEISIDNEGLTQITGFPILGKP